MVQFVSRWPPYRSARKASMVESIPPLNSTATLASPVFILETQRINTIVMRDDNFILTISSECYAHAAPHYGLIYESTRRPPRKDVLGRDLSPPPAAGHQVMSDSLHSVEPKN